jgi:UDP-N-acetylmuramate dehydrogenase
MELLLETFGERLLINELLAKYTSARLGGPADALVIAQSSYDLEDVVTKLWEMDVSFYVMGGGSNILVSDAGVRGVVVLNKAKKVVFDEENSLLTVWAESGSGFGAVARQAAQMGFSGLEWAAGIPGTVGGAVVGNAGAHGGDVASILKVAEILQHDVGRQRWTLDQLVFSYRSSVLKSMRGQAVVLSATLKLSHGKPEEIQQRMDEFLGFRRSTQPPGASMGSMFKNPPDDFAGRLIDEAGLKGTRIGDAEISTLHANFFINHGSARAQDVYALIQRARQAVLEKLGVELELEIELFGEWEGVNVKR